MQINIGAIIKSKNPELYKKIPKFVLWIARKILYEKSMNKVLAKQENLEGVEFTTTFLDNIGIKRELYGFEKIDKNKNYVFASNHPLGGLDGLALVEGIERKFEGTKVIVNDLLMNITPLKMIFLPVNKHGRQSVEYAKLVASHFENNKAIIYFPAGLCSRKIDGKVTDLPWKRNFVQKAVEYKRDIVPIFVDELNSPLFYNIERYRKILGIKMNIGMLMLPHEMFRKGKQKRSIKIFFGEPISYRELSTTHSVQFWCDEIRNRVYSLTKENK